MVVGASMPMRIWPLRMLRMVTVMSSSMINDWPCFLLRMSMCILLDDDRWGRAVPAGLDGGGKRYPIDTETRRRCDPPPLRRRSEERRVGQECGGGRGRGRRAYAGGARVD